MYNACRGLVDTDSFCASKLDMSKIHFVREVWANHTVTCFATLHVLHGYCVTTIIGQQCNFSNEILVQYFRGVTLGMADGRSGGRHALSVVPNSPLSQQNVIVTQSID